MDERILSGVLQTAEADPEVTLRPRALLDFIGQPKLKETLGVFLQAARQRQEPLDHVLLCGPPGLGKTTLAHIIAREMGAQIRVTSGPVLEKAGDLAAILTNLAPGDVLFVDEHGLDEIDLRILTLVIERFSGGPVGLSALAHSLGEDKGTLEDLYEPFLLQSGFLQRTPKGRVASALAYRHLGLKPASGPGTLFG